MICEKRGKREINSVGVIGDRDIIRLEAHLRAFYGSKHHLLFVIGLETGLRVSDVLGLKSGDVRETGFEVIEKKTKKKRVILLTKETWKEITNHRKKCHLRAGDYLIYSRENCKDKALSRVQAYRVINRAARELQIPEVGTHSMRKTFAYKHYKEHGDIEKLREILNHKYVSTTVMYLFKSLRINETDE